jgi:hypothetical protein
MVNAEGAGNANIAHRHEPPRGPVAPAAGVTSLRENSYNTLCDQFGNVYFQAGSVVADERCTQRDQLLGHQVDDKLVIPRLPGYHTSGIVAGRKKACSPWLDRTSRHTHHAKAIVHFSFAFDLREEKPTLAHIDCRAIGERWLARRR